MRTGTANTYDNALQQLLQRQSDLAGQQEKLTSGKRVNRASDDPQAAALAERAMVKINRVETDQRAVPESLVRISVGLEDPAELIADLCAALHE